MNDDLQALESFEGTARLLPLPNVVLFPQVMLPLHIFEQRYRQMTEDALDGDRLIALVLLRPGWEADYEGRPPLSPVACLGRILAEQRFEDGRFNLLLRGLRRVRIVQELQEPKLYRVARVMLLGDTEVPPAKRAKDYRQQLACQGSRWFGAMGVAPEQFARLVESDLALGALADVLTFALPFGVEFKQELLEELAVECRVRRLLAQLESTELPKPAQSAPRTFPPGFSSN
jgi:Lon protease-like protein